MNKINYPLAAPAWLLDIPEKDYHAATKAGEYLSSHRLHTFRKCPELYRREAAGLLPSKDTHEFAFGRATHTFILQGREAFAREFEVGDGPINEKTGKPFGTDTKRYADWVAAQPKPIVSGAEFALLENLRAAVFAHDAAAGILSCGIAEAVVRSEVEGVAVQTRMDWFDPTRKILADLKTCNDLDRFTFDLRDFGYAYQMAFYAETLRTTPFGELPEHTYLIAVEKKEPFRVGVWEVSVSTLDDLIWAPEKAGMRPMLKEYREAFASGKARWATRYEGVGVI